MVKRLTEYFENGAYTEKKNIIDVSDKVKFFDNGCVMGEAVDKLAKLEDILEKYGVDVEELNQMLEWLFTLSGQDADDMKFIARDRKLIHQQYCDIKTDRDTWKRACEFLAYKYAEEYFDGRDIEHCFNANKRDKFVKENINYFYQQAKTEGSDEK